MVERTEFESASVERIDLRDPHTLLADYIDVCNEAIEQNRDTRWFQQLSRLSRKYGKPVNLRAIVYDRNPDDVVTGAVVRFNPFGPQLEMLPAGDYDMASLAWKLPLDYLEDVTLQRSAWYIENPLRLDFSWMKERLRDEVQYHADMPSLATGFIAGAFAGLLLGWTRKKKSDRELRYLKDEINRLSDYE